MEWLPLMSRPSGHVVPHTVATFTTDAPSRSALSAAAAGDGRFVWVTGPTPRGASTHRVGQIWRIYETEGDQVTAEGMGRVWLRDVRDNDGVVQGRVEWIAAPPMADHPLHEALEAAARTVITRDPSLPDAWLQLLELGGVDDVLTDRLAHHLGEDVRALIADVPDPVLRTRIVLPRLQAYADSLPEPSPVPDSPALHDDLGPPPDDPLAYATWLTTLRVRHGTTLRQELLASVREALAPHDVEPQIVAAIDAHDARAAAWARPTDAERLLVALGQALEPHTIAFAFSSFADPDQALDDMHEAFAATHRGVVYAHDHDLDTAAMGHGLCLRFHGFSATTMEVARVAADAVRAQGLPIHWPEREDTCIQVLVRWELPAP